MKRKLLLLLLAAAVRLPGQNYGLVSTYAGSGSSGYADGPVASARFNMPNGLCADPSTNTVYVADTYNHCIRVISGGVVSTLAGDGTSGAADGQGANARFNQPTGICYSNGWLYVTDGGNNTIRKVDLAGNVTTLAGNGTAGYLDGAAASAEFQHPTGVDVNASGDLIVADCDNHCLRRISGGMVTTFAGVGGVAGDQIGPAASAKFNCPHSIFIAATGYVYFTDMLNHKIKEVTPTGTVFTIAGTGVAGYQDGGGTIAEFSHPMGITGDLSGNLLVADGFNNRIRRCTIVGDVSTVAGLGPVGYVNGPVAGAQFYFPVGIVRINGTALISDSYNHTIRRLEESDTGIPDHAGAISLSVYPNPAADRVIVETALPGTDAMESISIFSNAGALIREIQTSSPQNAADIYTGDLAPGLYEFRIRTRDGRCVSASVVLD